MSTRRERAPSIPDRLPGEQELSQLYQQTPDERPAAALDAAILTEAHRAARPRLRLIQGGRIGPIARRWALPLSLVASLIVTIGVITTLKEDSGRPLMTLQPEKAPAVSASAREVQPERQDVRKKAKQRATAVPSGDAVEFNRHASHPAFSPSRAIPLLGKAEEEADAALIAPVPAQEAMPQEEPKGILTDARTGQRIRHADTKYQVDRSPKDWLADISQLFRAGKRREAEESLQAFQDRYPDYTDYPDSFPEDVLKRLRTSTAQTSTTPQSR